MTPLMTACEFGSAATVRVLLEHGASVDLCTKVRDLQHAHTKAVPSYRARGAVAPPVSQAIVTTYPHCFVSLSRMVFCQLV